MRPSFFDAGCNMPISFAIAALLASATPEPSPPPLIAAEYGFAADAQRFGVRMAFLAHFDSDSWLFRPHPVPALAALARDPDDGSPLEWTPEIAGISAGGMPARVKCLHVLVAHALAAGPGANPLGDEALALLPDWWTAGPCVP